MGCICCKASAIGDRRESPLESRVRETKVQAKDRTDGGDRRAILTDKNANGSRRLQTESFERERKAKIEYAGNHHPRMGKITKATEGEQVAAGWPPWLAAVAGEAIKGWVPLRRDSFDLLSVVGRGSYSSVYKARNILLGKNVAMKRVKCDRNDPKSVKFLAREILILRRLDHPNIVKLEGIVISRMDFSLYLVFEYMEHDLAGLSSNPDFKLTEPQIKCYMLQLLCGLNHCHSRGILHRDIKCSNLLIDNNGILKVADFGLSSFYDPKHSHPLTSHVVTLWYRPPELLLGAHFYGVAVDLWSTGCVLAELCSGKPIMPGRTEVEQLHKIFKLCGSPSEGYWLKLKLPPDDIFMPQKHYKRSVAEKFKDFPPAALGLIETLLSIDPADRGTAASALRSKFFTSNPLACDPSSLPEYPPSKELDAKVWDEKARRQKTVGKGKIFDHERRAPRASPEIPEPDAINESVLSMQRRQGKSNSETCSKNFNSQHDGTASGVGIDPPRQLKIVEKTSKDSLGNHSGLFADWAAQVKTRKNLDGALKDLTHANIAELSGLDRLVAERSDLLSKDLREKSGPSQPKPKILLNRFPRSLNEDSESESTKRGQRKCYALDVTSSHPKNYGRLNNEELSLHNCGSKGNMFLGSSSNKDQIFMDRHGSKGSKTHHSGPLCSSGNVDHKIWDHDEQIKAFLGPSRSLGHHGSKGNKTHHSGPLLCSSSSSNVDQILMSHDRQIQEFVQRSKLRHCKS